MARRLSHFELGEPLGEGGMGVVHTAFDLALERTVAIKLLRGTGDPAERERFLAEARAASAINHPNVVTVHEVGSEDDTDFIVMERVEGRTLAELLRRGPLPQQEALRHARDIADGLACAHRFGLVHRDLKPGNVMVDAQGRLKILDFGLAKRSPIGGDTLVLAAGESRESPPPLTEPGMVVGTPAYMSPEQARGEPVDARSDLFSLGCLLYEMLAGVPPFRGATPVQVLAAVLSEDPALPPGLPPPLGRLLRSLLAKSRAARPASADQVRDELQALLDADTLRLPQAAPAHKRPALWLGAALVAVVLVAWLAWPDSTQPPSPPEAPPQLAFRLLSESAPHGGQGSFSPDGSGMVFVRADAGGIPQLWIQSIEGGAPLQLTSGDRAASWPDWGG
jgi:eukaryotic-like serine/threonine-protein kinase